MAYDYSSASCYNFSTLFPLPNERQEIIVNFTSEQVGTLWNVCTLLEEMEKESKMEDTYSKPMVWIGIYIALASLFCILGMAADLWNGFRYRKFWFPCKYFSLNAVSITIITVTMKLPMDLNSRMVEELDKTTKLGSLVFMCTMIANLMPSLASIDNKELPANVIGLAILIITIIVNVIMEMITGVIGYYAITCIYVVMLLFKLMVLISVAISVPISKQMLELKYQAISKKALNDQHTQGRFINERLRKHVTIYGIMVKTGSPQFVMAGNVLSSASGIMCGIGLVIYILKVRQFIRYPGLLIVLGSQYKWSMCAIFIIQLTGVLVGSIAPIFRCTRVTCYKYFARLTRKHIVIFEVEKYWTQKLHEWKESHIAVLSGSRRSRGVFRTLKRNILSLWIKMQNATIVTCKMIFLLQILVLIFVMYCSNNLKFLKKMLSNTITSNDDTNEDLSEYVLLLEDNMELAEKTLKRISHSMNRLIQTAEKKQDKNLLKLLEQSIGSEGVSKFDIFQVEHPLPFELPNSWSLPIATLTCIAIALPNIGREITDNLFKSVGEGLSYTHLVDESLNNVWQYVNVHNAAMTLWDEVEDKCKWLGNTLEKSAYEGKTAKEILEWFSHKADDIVKEVYNTCQGEPIEKLPRKLIIASSMKRIAQSIICIYNISEITKKQLFVILSRMIAEIFVACFTNIPRVITIKCHESEIERREASFEVAAKLLGRTTEIIKVVATYELPSMDLDKLAFIDEWRRHLQRIP